MVFYFDIAKYSDFIELHNSILEAAENYFPTEKRPLCLYVSYRNTVDHRFQKDLVVRFDPDTIIGLFQGLENPYRIWDQKHVIGSDVASVIANTLAKRDMDNNKLVIDKMIEPVLMVLYQFGEDLSNVESPLRETLQLYVPPPISDKIRHEHGFFRYDLTDFGKQELSKLKNVDNEPREFFKHKPRGFVGACWIAKNLQKACHLFQLPFEEYSREGNSRVAEKPLFEERVENIPQWYWTENDKTAWKSSKKQRRERGMPCHCWSLKLALAKSGHPLAKQIVGMYKVGELGGKATVSTVKFADFLAGYGCRVKIYKLSEYESGTRVTYNISKKVCENEILLEFDRFQDHLMVHYTPDPVEDKWLFDKKLVKKFNILQGLRYLLEQKMIKPLNGYEVYKRMDFTGAFDQQCEFVYKKFLKQANPWCIPEEFQRRVTKKVDKGHPPFIGFFDFEASTDEDHHKPYCVSYCLEDSIEKFKDSSFTISNIWADDLDCARQFLKKVGYFWFSHGMPVRKRRMVELPIVVLYAHNLAYDCTFLKPFLTDRKVIEQGGRVYRVEGTYTYFRNKTPYKIRIALQDTLCLFQTSLRNVGRDYIWGEEAKTIKKEVFPYNWYIFENFKKHQSGWVSVEEIKRSFKDEPEKYKEFIRTLYFFDGIKGCDKFEISRTEVKEPIGETSWNATAKKHNKVMKIEYSVGNSWYYPPNNWNDTWNTEYEDFIMKFNYKEYAKFYCDQDVRVLARAFYNLRQLYLGNQLEGSAIHGNLPFSIDILDKITASGIAFDWFLDTVVGGRNNPIDEACWPDEQETEDIRRDVCIDHPRMQSKSIEKLVQEERSKRYLERIEERREEFIHKCNGPIRAIILMANRGGRCMTRDNDKWYYSAAKHNGVKLQDYDAVSLYPSAMRRLWLSTGRIKVFNPRKTLSQEDFLQKWLRSDIYVNPEKKWTDAVLHVTKLNSRRKLHFPVLCLRNPADGLNEWRNFDNEAVDTWINAIDLENFIEFQQGEFEWDSAIYWDQTRDLLIQKQIQALFDFRKANKEEDNYHPIEKVAKTMMNSISGKSITKIHKTENRYLNYNKFDNTCYYPKWITENAYRVKSLEICAGNEIKAKIYSRDFGYALPIFGQDVFAMARKIIQPIFNIAEDLEQEHPEMTPSTFYTDTDSLHIREDMLVLVEERYKQIYKKELKGKNLGEFHIDFDPVAGHRVLGAIESYFCAKKIYVDRLLLDNGEHSFHKRMKGVPNDLINWDHYVNIFNGGIQPYQLVDPSHPSFIFEEGVVKSRRFMERRIMLKEAREKLLEEANLLKSMAKHLEESAREDQKRPRTPPTSPEEERPAKLHRCDAHL